MGDPFKEFYRKIWTEEEFDRRYPEVQAKIDAFTRDLLNDEYNTAKTDAFVKKMRAEMREALDQTEEVK